MTAYEINKIELAEACKRFSKAYNAIKSGRVSVDVISNKGKTLMSVNRTLQNTVKMTVRA